MNHVYIYLAILCVSLLQFIVPQEKVIASPLDSNPPTLNLTLNPTSITNESMLIEAFGTDDVGIESIQLPDGNWVNSNYVQYVVNKNGVYSFTTKDTSGNVTTETILVETIIKNYSKATFDYFEDVQIWTVPKDGEYLLETFGAQGALNGGLGGKAESVFSLLQGDKLFIRTGGQNGFNGGGIGYLNANGGGATDIRLNTDTVANRLIMGAGGGGYTGGTVGGNDSGAGGVNLGSGGGTPGTNGGGGGRSYNHIYETGYWNSDGHYETRTRTESYQSWEILWCESGYWTWSDAEKQNVWISHSHSPPCSWDSSASYGYVTRYKQVSYEEWVETYNYWVATGYATREGVGGKGGKSIVKTTGKEQLFEHGIQSGNGLARISPYNSKPIVTVTTPSNNQTFKEGSSISLIGTILDTDASGRMQVKYQVDNSSEVLSLDTTNFATPQPFSSIIPLADDIAVGNHTIKVWGEDSDGAKSDPIILTFIIPDYIPPTLTYTLNPTTWTNGSVTISVTGADKDSGVNRIQIPTGQWYSGATRTHAVSVNGIYTFQVEDKAGNVHVKDIEVTTIDKTAPNAPTISGDSEWTKTPQTITIQDTGDTGSGIKNIQYSLSGATSKGWTNYTDPIVISANGQTTVSARVVDNVGLVSTITTKVIKVDNILPTVSHTLNPSGWTKDSVKINLNTSDSLSGVKRTKLPNGTWVTDAKVQYDVFDNDTYYFVVEDFAGNQKEYEVITSKFDFDKPSITLTPNITQWTRSNVSVNVRGTDIGSGFSYVMGPNGSRYNSANFNYNISVNGTYEFIGFDGVGNSVTERVTIENIDTTAPTMNLVPNITDWTNEDVIIDVITEDVQSGVKQVRLPNGSWVAPNQATYSVGANGTYTFYVQDNIGNQLVKSITIANIDRIIPSMTHTLNPNTWTNDRVNITLTGSDTQSGVKRIQQPDGQWIDGNTLTYVAETNGTFNFVVEDSVGNVKPYPVTITRIDKTPPSTTLRAHTTAWISGNVNLNLNATDNESGVSRIVSPDGRTYYTTAIGHSATENGKYTFLTYDVAGNENINSIVVDNIDKTAPTIDLSVNITEYTDQDVTITAKATDDQSGVSRILAPNGGWILADEVSYTISANGTYTFYSQDKVGNQVAKSITISNIAPSLASELVSETIPSVMEIGETYDVEITLRNIGKTPWTKDVFKLGAWGNSDSFTSIIRYDLTKDIQFMEEVTFQIRMLAPKTQNTYVTDWGMIRTNSWLERVVNKSVKVKDTIAPDLLISPSISEWTNQNITLTATARDSGSGIQRIYYPNGRYVNGTVGSYLITENGDYTFRAVDNVNNEISKTITISNIDKVAPTLSLETVVKGWVNTPVMITAVGNDALSGVKRIQLPNGSWISASTVEYTATNGTHTFVVEDNAGNTTTRSILISNVDLIAPTQPVITAPTDWVKDTPVNVTISQGTDTESGVSHVEYKLAGATTEDWTEYRNPIKLKTEGITVISARTVDRVGNVSIETTKEVKIDLSTPYNTNIIIKLKP